MSPACMSMTMSAAACGEGDRSKRVAISQGHSGSFSASGHRPRWAGEGAGDPPRHTLLDGLGSGWPVGAGVAALLAHRWRLSAARRSIGV